MSALAGLWYFDGKPYAGEACARMLAAQAVYGPHASNLWSGSDVALGRNLHRSLPEDVHDEQPIIGGGGDVLVADLRLDNRDELAAALDIALERAKFMADSAILMAAWQRWGLDMCDRLIGDYAFALWDATKRRIVMARDPMGMRPLHYCRRDGFFAFASMPKGLHALPEVERRPNEQRIAEFMLLVYAGSTSSFFHDVSRVEPGTMVVVTRGGHDVLRHWSPRRRTLSLRSQADYTHALLHHLDQAVSSRLRGVGDRVAAHLSSGLDSTAVASSAARIMSSTGGKVIAFTAVPREGYDGPSPRGGHGNEGPLAAKTAALYPNMLHELIRSDARSPIGALDRNFSLFEEPIFNLCNATWVDAINDAAKAKGIGVLLVGSMGNITISYTGMALLPQLVGQGRWLKWLREAHSLTRAGASGRGILAQSLGPFMSRRLWALAKRAAGRRIPDVRSFSAIREEYLAKLDIPALADGRDGGAPPTRDGFAKRLWSLNRVDLGNYNKGVLGGWGIDQRDPTADRRVIEFCLSVPEDQYLRSGQPKALLRAALAERVASELLRSRSKGIQAVDYHEGLTAARDGVAAEINAIAGCIAAERIIDLPRLKGLMENWPSDGWERPDVMIPYRQALLRALSAGHFLRRASDPC